MTTQIFRHGRVLLEIEAALDLDRLVSDDTDPEQLPYWAVQWEAGRALARWLVEQDRWRGVCILELGCGVGLAGLTAAVLGARVLQTDRVPEATSVARSNARRNGVRVVRQAAADWRHWPLRSRWPVVLGSDLIYERPSQPALLDVLSQSLAPGGTAYLTDPGRPMSAEFVDKARRSGWEITRFDIGVDLYELRRAIDAIER